MSAFHSFKQVSIDDEIHVALKSIHVSAFTPTCYCVDFAVYYWNKWQTAEAINMPQIKKNIVKSQIMWQRDVETSRKKTLESIS